MALQQSLVLVNWTNGTQMLAVAMDTIGSRLLVQTYDAWTRVPTLSAVPWTRDWSLYPVVLTPIVSPFLVVSCAIR